MYGKHFTSMYSGSLFGKPAIVFAVWGYAFSHMRQSRGDDECYVELNPTLLAATFATTVEDVISALEVLESPDASSRSKSDAGRRLIFLGDDHHSGPMQFRVVNGTRYRAMRDEEERRVYLRDAKRKERAKKSPDVNNVNNVNRGQPSSTQAEAEAEAVKPPCASAQGAEMVLLFEELWARYPRKKGKQAALESFKRTVRTDEDLADMRKALENARREFATRDRNFIPYGSVWFGDGKRKPNWRDDVVADNHNDLLPASGRPLEVVL